jgi:hypothetical protein
MFGLVYPGGDRSHAKKLMYFNIYKSKDILKTKDDENYERRVGVKELLFYMQRDPLLKKSKVYYQNLVKKFWNLIHFTHIHTV